MFYPSRAAGMHNAARGMRNLLSSPWIELCYFVKPPTSSSQPKKNISNIPTFYGCGLTMTIGHNSWHGASPQFLCFINRWCILPINIGKGLEVSVLTHLLVLLLFSAWVLSSVFSRQDQTMLFLHLSHALCPYCVVSPQLQLSISKNVMPDQVNH